MRVSTHSMYELGTGSMLGQQASMVKTQQQMASGRRMLSAADDPAAAAAALRTAQSLARSQRLEANQDAANSTLATAESVLGAATDVLQAVQDRLLQAQNATLSASERSMIADEVDGMMGRLLGLANTRDASGAYLFAGYAEATIPFVDGPGGVAYQGDDGERRLELAPGRSIAVSAPGSEVFMRVKTGNGVFATAAGASNTGGGMIDAGSVADPVALTGHAYRLTFNAGGTSYDVHDLTAGVPVATGNAFTAGQAITVAGMQMTIKGLPAAGDTFTLTPSGNQSVFETIGDAVAALRSAAPGAVRQSTVNSALASLNQGMDRIGVARAELGARLGEIETHRGVTGAAVLEHRKRLSELQDLDYTDAATRLMRQQTAVEAAQQSFAKLAKLSLFNYLG